VQIEHCQRRLNVAPVELGWSARRAATTCAV